METRMRPCPRARRSQAGFTLIELMVAMVVSAIVVLGVYAFSSIQSSTASMHERNVRVQQALEGAMWTMAKDVRMAGLGHSRVCSELRIFDVNTNQVINPGATLLPSAAVTDAVTGSAYWVLRDGLQAHWNSGIGTTFDGNLARSASPTSVADAFDVVLADSAYVGTYGVFRLEVLPADAGGVMLAFRTSDMLDNTNAQHLQQVQQLFPPGTFFALARSPGAGINPFAPENHGQCPLLQVTDDVFGDQNDPQRWWIPTDGAVSGFDAGMNELFSFADEFPDWNQANDAVINASIIPLGRLRWSRYELDYTVPTLPYLVRYDIIGFRDGDPANLGNVDYPFCASGQCPAPQLHLPDSNSPPSAVAVGPMIEDMQVAVGCDGYSALAAGNASPPINPPDLGFEELGPAVGATAGVANHSIDENPSGSDRDRDEWIGNARSEQLAPDCVWYGTAERDPVGWTAIEGTQNPPPNFRMSPQSIRITLVGSAETDEAAGGLATLEVLAVEDRPPTDSSVGIRQRFTLTEVFTPKNLRWRDPTVP